MEKCYHFMWMLSAWWYLCMWFDEAKCKLNTRVVTWWSCCRLLCEGFVFVFLLQNSSFSLIYDWPVLEKNDLGKAMQDCTNTYFTVWYGAMFKTTKRRTCTNSRGLLGLLACWPQHASGRLTPSSKNRRHSCRGISHSSREANSCCSSLLNR
jgi:hypothetical protein